MMDPRSAKILKKLHPILQEKLPIVIAALKARGFTVGLTQGERTFAEQDGLYMQGRTRPGPKVTNAKGGQSYHQYRLAADFALLDANGRPSWPDPHPVWAAIAAEAERAGLSSGYRWKHQDKPHVEMPELTWRECLAIYNKAGKGEAGLKAVEAEATRRFKGE